LFYFAESPFFDSTSNNANLAAQATRIESMRHIIATREAFEARLQMMQGLEFMVAHDPLLEYGAALDAAKAARASPAPAPEGGPAATTATAAPSLSPPAPLPQMPSNIWVIRKQYRRKSAGRPDEVDVLATYFVVDDAVFQAPSVGGVIGSRLLSTVTFLTKSFQLTSSLPLFSASHGNTYTPVDATPLGAVASTSTTQSRRPESQSESEADAQTQPPAKPQPPLTPAQSASMQQNAHNLAKGLQLTHEFGNEYIDETPLLGEPGSFLFASATATRKAADAQHAKGAAASASTTASTTSTTDTGAAGGGSAGTRTARFAQSAASVVAGPSAPASPGSAAAPARSAIRGGAAAGSPRSPLSPLSPLSPRSAT
ncbi:Mediator of RNA polymerase II transcription subunit 6, partial [Ascosphaera acerosa]